MSVVLITLMVVLPLTTPILPADEIDDAIASLEKALKEKGKADIKHFVALLGDKFASAKPEQQKNILRLDGLVLNQSDQELKDAAVEAIAKTGDAKGVPLLTKEMDKKTTEDNSGYFATCIKALGRLKDPKAGLDRLMKLLKHKTIDVVATATEALANYKDAAFETKKSIVDDLLKIYGSIASAANDPRDSTAKAKLTRLQPAADETLRNLTGQQFKSHPDWLKWWNDSGKKATKW
jgi:HEAT repeat protein